MLAAFEAQEHQAADETSNNSIKVEVKEEVEAKEIEPEETEMKTGDMKQEDIEKKM